MHIDKQLQPISEFVKMKVISSTKNTIVSILIKTALEFLALVHLLINLQAQVGKHAY